MNKTPVQTPFCKHFRKWNCGKIFMRVIHLEANMNYDLFYFFSFHSVYDFFQFFKFTFKTIANSRREYFRVNNIQSWVKKFNCYCLTINIFLSDGAEREKNDKAQIVEISQFPGRDFSSLVSQNIYAVSCTWLEIDFNRVLMARERSNICGIKIDQWKKLWNVRGRKRGAKITIDFL